MKLPDFRLEGQIAMVTGASSGLGKHFAKLLASAGAHVIVAARRVEPLEALVAEIQETNGQAASVSMDVSNPESVKRAFDYVGGEIGLPNILINNAGITITRPLLEQSEEDWESVIGTNLTGGWRVATELARRWVADSRQGVIIHIASILGERVAGGIAPYAISKAGVVQSTKVMALELARFGIRSNALLPGYVVTDLNREFLASEAGEKLRLRIPTRRFCQPEELNGPLLLLASDAGRAMTGTCLVVDGGHLVSSL
jgi:NAD(P)-dependent dehydrogenase (short-subunit alcohol dehydrogenase family)